MSLAFEDFEKDYPSSEAKQAKNETPTSVVRKPSVGVKPSVSDALSQAWGQVSPMIASGAERAINPIHYKGDQEDYTNIDWPLTALHAGGEAVALKRIWDFATGKSEERKTARINAEANKSNAEIARMNSEARGAPLRTAAPIVQTPIVPQPAPQTPSLAERTIGGPAQTDIPAYLRKQQAAPAIPTAPAVPVTPTMSAEQAAARVAEMPEHPNPITKIEPSTLTQVGSSETAKISKKVTEQQKKIKGKSGGAVEPKSLTEHIAKATAIEPFKRNESGTIQWPEKMSPAARAGAEQFATQFPDVAKELEAKGKFGILGAGSGDNNLYNSYGSDMMKTLRNEVNQGQMVGDYFNYKNKVNPAVMAISPETPLGKQLEDLRVNQPKGGVHGQLGQPVAMKEGKLLVDANKLNKTLKAGGAAALLMSITNAANAKEAARNVGEAILPWGMTPSEVESGKLTEKQLKAFEEAQKLGSPYRSVPPPR